MRLYLNPTAMSKEQWLLTHGVRSTGEELVSSFQKMREEGFVPVVLVDNGAFTAGAIGYSFEETAEFCRPGDSRQKLFFKAPIAELKNIPGFQEQMARYGLT